MSETEYSIMVALSVSSTQVEKEISAAFTDFSVFPAFSAGLVSLTGSGVVLLTFTVSSVVSPISIADLAAALLSLPLSLLEPATPPGTLVAPANCFRGAVLIYCGGVTSIVLKCFHHLSQSQQLLPQFVSILFSYSLSSIPSGPQTKWRSPPPSRRQECIGVGPFSESLRKQRCLPPGLSCESEQAGLLHKPGWNCETWAGGLFIVWSIPRNFASNFHSVPFSS